MERGVSDNISSVSEASRSVRISQSQGGTMLKVWPLAITGLRPVEISRISGLSLKQVYQAEYQLRRKGRIPESHIEFNKWLEEQLVSPPEDSRDRQTLLDLVKFSYYRSHKYLFASARKVLPLAGLHVNSQLDMQGFEIVIKENGIPSKDFNLVRRENGQTIVRHYRIILRCGRDLDLVVSALGSWSQNLRSRATNLFETPSPTF